MTIDLEAANKKYARWEPLGDIPPSVFTDLRTLIDELTEARRALGVEKANIDTLVTSCETLTAKLAHARAAALAEAAAWHVNRIRELGREVSTSDVENERRLGRLAAHERSADAMPLLSATPATVVCVPVETVRVAVVGMTQVRDCIEGGWDPHKGSPLGRAKWADAMRNVRAALAEMAKVTP